MFKKIILIVGVLVVLIAVVLGIGGYWALHKINSPEFKHILEAKISEATGVRVEFEKINIGLSATEITSLAVPAQNSAKNENFLFVKTLKVHYSITKLFSTPVTVAKIEIDEPKLIVRQDAGGNVTLPVEKAPTTPAAETATPAVGTLISLPEIYIRNASLDVYAADESLLFSAEQAYVQASYDRLPFGHQQVSANLSVKQLLVTPGLHASDFTSPVVFKNNKLTLDKIQTGLYGGTLTGNADVDLSVTPATFGATATISQSDLGALLGDLGNDPETVIGKFDLNFSGNGSLDAPKNLTGKGDLLIPSPVIGKLKPYQNLAQIIGTLGGISFLKEGKFDNIKTSFTLGEQKLQLNPLAVNSANLTINLAGPVTFDKQLDLKGEVILAPGLLQVAQTVENIIGAVNAIKHPDQSASAGGTKTPDQLKFPLTVSGPAADPKIGLDTGATPNPSTPPPTVQEKTQSIINTLGNLFNKKKEEPKPAETEP